MKTAAKIFSVFLLIFITLTCRAADNLKPPSPQNPASYAPYMSELIKQAKDERGLPFKAMIINNRTGEILCRGKNNSRVNPLLHGEMAAINNCASQYGKHMPWHHSTLITTAEPCPMCTGGAIWSRISVIVYGSSIPTLIKKGWSQINLRAYQITKHSPLGKPQLIGGVLKEQTDALFPQRDKASVKPTNADAQSL